MTDYSKYNQNQINSSFLNACGAGDVALVKYLLTSDELKFKAEIDFNSGEALIRACRHDRGEVVSYLLVSPDLSQHADIHARADGALMNACSAGHLNIVKYLLTSPELSEHANISIHNDSALRLACIAGHLDVVRYLLTDKSLDKHANLYALANDSPSKGWCGLNCAFDNHHMTVVNFLLYDMRMEISDQCLCQMGNESKRQELQAVIKKRDFFLKINDNLTLPTEVGKTRPKL